MIAKRLTGYDARGVHARTAALMLSVWALAAPVPVAAQPRYRATVLPQLDTTSEAGVLTSTRPAGFGRGGEVIVSAGDGRLHRWVDGGAEVVPVPEPLTLANAVNREGAIVGRYLTSRDTPEARPFLQRADGAFERLTLGGDDTLGEVTGINDGGLMVGFVRFGELGTRAVWWRDGVGAEISGLTGDASAAVAVNETGTVALWAALERGRPEAAFRWTPEGGLETLPSLSADHGTRPTAISGSGVVVGVSYRDREEPRAVLWDAEGRIHLLRRLAPDDVELWDLRALGVSDAGIVVGTELAGDVEPFSREALVWYDGEPHSLRARVDDLPDELTLTVARYVDETGVILAEATRHDDERPQVVTVLLTPVGDPAGEDGGTGAGAPDAGAPVGATGCGCRVGAPGPPAPVWLFLAGLLTRRARRRRGRRRGRAGVC